MTTVLRARQGLKSVAVAMVTAHANHSTPAKCACILTSSCTVQGRHRVKFSHLSLLSQLTKVFVIGEHLDAKS